LLLLAPCDAKAITFGGAWCATQQVPITPRADDCESHAELRAIIVNPDEVVAHDVIVAFKRGGESFLSLTDAGEVRVQRSPRCCEGVVPVGDDVIAQSIGDGVEHVGGEDFGLVHGESREAVLPFDQSTQAFEYRLDVHHVADVSVAVAQHPVPSVDGE
jgi:hypothetical protein